MLQVVRRILATRLCESAVCCTNLSATAPDVKKVDIELLQKHFLPVDNCPLIAKTLNEFLLDNLQWSLIFMSSIL